MKIVTGENLTAEDIDRIVTEAFVAVFKKGKRYARRSKGDDVLS